MSKNICKTLALALLSLVILTVPAEAGEHKKDEGQKKEYSNHFKFYGFIRNFFAYDTRESVAGTGDLFYWVPKDRNLNELGEDLNQQSSFRFLAITSRLGVDVSGYQVGRTKFGAKVETDFYAGLTGSTGTATLRLRQAYATIGWDHLPMAGEAEAAVKLTVGQAWHPMSADQPMVLALETGAPFNPFSRTPQVTMDASLGDHFIITGSAIWQMQYISAGPAGASADYIKYGCTPEMYAGLTFRTKNGFLMRAGANLLSIKPRNTGTVMVDGKPVTVKVDDRITTVSPYLYLQYAHRSFQIKAKTLYGQAGEHMGLMSGYGISGHDAETGTDYYEPLRNSTSWVSLSLGKKVQGQLFVGYTKNLGSARPFEEYSDTDAEGYEPGYTDASNIFFSKTGFSNINQMYRIMPSVVYNIGKFSLGLEYALTSVQYGDYKKFVEKDGTVVKALKDNGLATDNLHWVSNHRVQMMFRFTF